MNLREALDTIGLVMARRTDLDDLAKAQMALAQEHFQKGPTFPWFLLSEIAATSTTVGGWRIPFPNDFLEEYEDGALWLAESGEDMVGLEKHDLDTLLAEYGSTSEGAPECYSLDGKYFRVFPAVPDEEYPLKMLYYKADTDFRSLGDTDTNLWLTHSPYTLIGRAGDMLATGLRDSVASAKFQKMEAEARVLLVNENEARKHINRKYQIGGPC
jgi:hypothetical protein